MVYYRKYRPQTLLDLDSVKVQQTLTSVLSAKEIPHAFLFTGPKGLGKTSTARIVAKVVNCLNRKEGSAQPCNECDQCLSITNGSNIDVLEIDGASNRGIDEIRDLRDKVKLSPSSAKKKVYIIDEVHMLTTEAFNALLKTIEEPPAHVMFIFCTTEPQKVPATIISRCFHISFERATEKDIVHSLKRIVAGEKLDIEESVLEMIAGFADGGFRDAAKILEELVLLANGEKITQEFAQNHYKTSNVISFVYTLLSSLTTSPVQLKESLTLVEEMVQQGIDMKFFISQILSVLHTLLLSQMDVEAKSTSIPENLQVSPQSISVLNSLFSDAYQKIKYSPLPQLPLELAIVAWSSSQESREEGETIMLTPQTSVVIKSQPTIEALLKKERTLKVRSIIDGKKEEKAPEKDVPTHTQAAIKSDIDPKASFMENIIYKVKSQNHSLAGVLRGCDIKVADDTQLVIETAYKFHKERLDDKSAKDILEKAVKEISGKPLKVVIELKEVK